MNQGQKGYNIQPAKATLFNGSPSSINGIIANIRKERSALYQYIQLSGGGTKKSRLEEVLHYRELELKDGSVGPKYWDNYNNKYKKCLIQDAWFQIDFKIGSVEIIGYLLGTGCISKDRHSPKSWRLFGSLNGKDWELIDKQVNCELMNGGAPLVFFNLERKVDPFKSIRIEMIEN